MKPLCKQLNDLIPIKGKEDKDKINALIYEVSQKVPDFNLYWDRELWIDCGCDGKKVRHYTLYSGKVHFELSDDPTEHPGVAVRYNDKTE
jgi:adenine specific DNA methylase Mod